ncbi:MAG TPA: dienelactone hydrolase family protein [Ktedonobacterales bacterium]
MATDFLPHGAPPIIERVEIGPRKVPALHLTPHDGAPASGLPVALIQHGYGAEKSDLLPLASLLVAHGFIALLPDAWGHGERFPASGPNWMTHISADFLLEVVRNTVDDMREEISWLETSPGARADQIILGGFSMGAIATLVVGTEDDRANGMIAASGASLPDLLPITLFGSAPPNEESQAWARRHDAAARIHAFAPKPLLIQHGRSDDMVPVAGAVRLHEAAEPHYTEHPDHLKLMLYPHSHMVSEQQMRDAVEWLVARFHPETLAS